jgi:hypothetical protein
MENILRYDQDGAASIGFITKIIDGIHSQYEAYLASSNAPKAKLTIEEIVKQLTRELQMGNGLRKSITAALPEVQSLLQAE